MANENIQMWTELGIDLKSHDTNEAVNVEKRLEKEGIPLLRVETDYSDEDTGSAKNPN